MTPDRTPPVLAPSTRAIRVLLAAGLIVLGAVLLFRPLTTLTVLVWAIAAASLAWTALLVRGAQGRAWAWISAAVLLGTGAAVLVFTSQLVQALPLILSILWGLAAVRTLWRAVTRGPTSSRVARILTALACGAAAVLTWLWPDVALLLLAWATALTLVIGGVVLAWRALRPARPRTRRDPRWGARTVAAGVALLLTVTASAGSVWAFADVPTVDDFYTWDGDLPDTPGTLLRVAAYEGEVPEGAAASRILYTTTHADGTTAVASAVVAVPTAPATDRAVLAWQHGTTGVAQTCAPSLTTEALTEYAIPGISRAIDRGWLVVATDYPGQGTDGRYPYLLGEGEGRATLDGVRAARQLDAANASDRVMLWGHSQGGHATLWAGEIAPTYAPELDVVGVAALSSASDPLTMAETVTGSGSVLGTAITSFVLVPYADEYDDISVHASTHPAGSTFATSSADRCVTARGMIVTLLVAVGLGDDDELYRLDLSAGPVHDRLTENIADGIVDAPLFLGQGTDDEVVPIEIQRALAAQLCAADRVVETHEYPGATHMGVIAEGAPLIGDLYTWADEVMAGDEPLSCRA